MLNRPSASPDASGKSPRGSSKDVFSSVLLSTDMHRPSQSRHSKMRKSFAPRANVVFPEEADAATLAGVSDSFELSDELSTNSYFDSSSELEMSSSEFNIKPLSWRVSYVVMKQFQESSNLLRMTTALQAGDVGHGNFYDIDDQAQRRLARGSFFHRSTTRGTALRLANAKGHRCSLMDRLILTPDNLVRQVWDIAVLFLLMYTLLFLPVKVAFYSTTVTNVRDIDPVDLVVDIMFLLDIVMSFISAYKLPDGTVVRHFDEIALKYCKSWFILDVVATFPFYLIGSSTLDRIAPIIRIPRLLKMLRLVRLVKLVRAYRLKKFFEKVEYSPKIHQGFIRIVKLLLLVICFAHFSACLWFFIGDLSEEEFGFSWISDMDSVYGGVKGESTSLQYIASLYFAISTLCTVGFGDITPQNGLEMCFAMILMIIGATTFSYITATISSVMHDFDVKASMYRVKMANLVGFVKSSNLSKKLGNKLVNNMSTLWSQEIKTNEDTSKLRDELPRLLLYEVSLEMHAALINTSAFFRLFDNLAENPLSGLPSAMGSPIAPTSRRSTSHCNLGAHSSPFAVHSPRRDSQLGSSASLGANISDFAFIGELVSEMRPETAFDGEFIANVAEPVNFWAIVKTGSVVAISAIDSSLELMLWGDGDSMGEVGIFLTQQWPWNMRCTQDTAYFTVSTSDFLAIIAHHRSVSRKLVKLAGQRIERIVKIKKKLRALQETKVRRQLSRSSKQMVHDKAKLHYRLQNLINAKTGGAAAVSATDPVASPTLSVKSPSSRHSAQEADPATSEMSEIAQQIHAAMRHDALKGTAQGRWKMLRMYVHETIERTRSKRDKFRTNFQEVTQLAMQVKRFQDALDEIQRDMVIWKQGMTFKANRPNRNFLQPANSLIHEE